MPRVSTDRLTELGRMLDIYPTDLPHCLRLVALWPQCLRRMGCIVAAFAVLWVILECRVALGKFDRAFQPTRKGFDLVFDDLFQSSHAGQTAAMMKENDRYNIAWLRFMGVIVIPKEEAKNLGNRVSERGLWGDIDDIPSLAESVG